MEKCIPDVYSHVARPVLFELRAGGDEVMLLVACYCTYPFTFCCGCTSVFVAGGLRGRDSTRAPFSLEAATAATP